MRLFKHKKPSEETTKTNGQIAAEIGMRRRGAGAAIAEASLRPNPLDNAAFAEGTEKIIKSVMDPSQDASVDVAAGFDPSVVDPLNPPVTAHNFGPQQVVVPGAVEQPPASANPK